MSGAPAGARLAQRGSRCFRGRPELQHGLLATIPPMNVSANGCSSRNQNYMSPPPPFTLYCGSKDGARGWQHDASRCTPHPTLYSDAVDATTHCTDGCLSICHLPFFQSLRLLLCTNFTMSTKRKYCSNWNPLINLPNAGLFALLQYFFLVVCAFT